MNLSLSTKILYYTLCLFTIALCPCKCFLLERVIEKSLKLLRKNSSEYKETFPKNQRQNWQNYENTNIREEPMFRKREMQIVYTTITYFYYPFLLLNDT